MCALSGAIKGITYALSHQRWYWAIIGETMINCITCAKVSQKTRVISLVRVLREIMLAHMIKDAMHTFRVIKFMFVMFGAYDATYRAQAGTMDGQLITLLQELAMLLSAAEDDSSASSETSTAQSSEIIEEPENDTRQTFVGVKRSSWIQSVTLESITPPEDMRSISGEQLFSFKVFLAKLNDHVGFNDEACVLENLPYDQFRVALGALHYLSFGGDKTELQVEKFMKHHCGRVELSIVVHLVRSGYGVTPTHVGFKNVKELYKQYRVMNGQPYHPRIIEDNVYGGSSSSSSPTSTMG